MQNNNKRKKGKEMKIKIRGLVFVGFAAAVFASSARADDPAPTPHIPAGQTAKTTVTSKNYVDAKFQAKEKRVEIGNGTGQYASVSEIPSSVKTNDYYPSMKVLADSMAGGDFQRKLNSSDPKDPQVGLMVGNESDWKPLRSTEHISVTTVLGSNNSPTEIDVAIPDGKIASTAATIGGTNNAGPEQADERDLTTAKAVYDYVNGGGNNGDGFHRKITESEAQALANINSSTDAGVGIEIGYRSYTAGTGGAAATYGTSEWAPFVAKANSNTGTNDHLSYLEINQETENAKPKFTIGIKGGALAENASAISAAGANDASYTATDKLTTAKAVYEFVTSYGNGEYQPKVDAPTGWDSTTSTFAHDTRNTIQVGRWNGSVDANGNVTSDSATWADFTAQADSGSDLGYLTIGQQVGGTYGSSYNINIDGNKIAKTSANIASAASDAQVSTTNKLATAGAVNAYAVKQDWTSEHANKTLVTNNDGIVTVSDVPAIPEFGANDVCKNSNVNCALVTTWVPAEGNTAAHMELHWTVMADNTDAVTNP